MANILRKVIYENFNGMKTLAENTQSDGGTTRFDIMSRFSGFDEDHSAVKNFDKLNMMLSPLYSTRNSKGQPLYWSVDDVTLNQNKPRGAFDRYFWSGAIEDTGTSAVFKSSTISAIETDGFAMIPSPYVDFTPGTQKFVHGNNEQDSLKLKIRFNDLPKNKFVPIFGYVYSHTGKASAATNSHGTIYKPRYAHSHQNMYAVGGEDSFGPNNAFAPKVLKYPKTANYPLASSANTTNLYEMGSNESIYQNDYQRNSILWFLYAHDGNGKGMIATCSGDAETNDPSASIYRPTNEHYGTNNGFLKFQAPHVLQNYLDEGNSLQDLWYKYNTGGESKEALSPADMRNAFSSVYYHYREDPYSWENWTSSQFQKNFPIGGYRFGNYKQIKYSGTNKWEGGASGWGLYGSLGWFPGPMNHSHLQLVAYGNVGDNADLKNYEEILINANTISKVNKSFNQFGINNLSSGKMNPCQIFYTGKMMGFTFKDIPGQMYWDKIRYEYEYGYANSDNRHKVSIEPMGYGPGALVLRPTALGEAEIDSFSISRYSSPAGEVFGGTTLLKDTFRSSKDNKYYFAKDGVLSYNPLNDVEQGIKNIEDPGNAWETADKMFDLDRNSRAELKKAGEENALYAPLNGSPVFNDTGNEAEYEVNEFTLNVSGVTLIDFKDHKIKCQIVDKTKSKILFETGTSENPDIITPVGKTVPLVDGSFIMYFTSDSDNVVTYADINDGYLKVWAEKL